MFGKHVNKLSKGVANIDFFLKGRRGSSAPLHVNAIAWFWVRCVRHIWYCFCSVTHLHLCSGVFVLSSMTSNCSVQTAPRWVDCRVKPGLWLNSGSRSSRKAQPALITEAPHALLTLMWSTGCRSGKITAAYKSYQWHDCCQVIALLT